MASVYVRTGKDGRPVYYVSYSNLNGERVRKRIGKSKALAEQAKRDVERLLASSEGTMFHGLIATALFAGLRMEELVWLEWTDIDFAAFSGQGAITVQNKPGWYTKSRKPRVIPMVPRLRAILARLPRRSRWCFPNVGGGQYLNDLQRDITEVFERAGLPYGLHALRHTFASRLVAEGVPITYVKELMGHASIQTTMVYLHATPRHLAEAVGGLSFGASQTTTHERTRGARA